MLHLHAILLSLTLTVIGATSPYCHQNETSVTYVPVLKTRIVTKSTKGFLGIGKKIKKSTETYVEQEKRIKWKLVPKCCEGYEMNHLKICNPICVDPQATGCTPQHPNHESTSVETNTYVAVTAWKESDSATNSNDATEQTINSIEPCENKGENCSDSTMRSSDERLSTDSTGATESTDFIEATTQQSTAQIECPYGFQYYDGDCLQVDLSCNESCPANSICQNGACNCVEGYTAHVQSNTSESLTPLEIVCISQKDLDKLSTNNDKDEESESELNWLRISIISLGPACIFCLIFLLFRLYRHRGTLDVKANNDLYCEYNNKQVREGQLVL